MSFALSGFNGIDTENIIQQLMWIEGAPKRRLESRKKEISGQVDIWQEINSSLSTLKSKAEDLEGIFNKINPQSSNEEVLTASATEDATMGSYEIEVLKLAKPHRVASARQSDTTLDLNLGAGTGGSFAINLAGGNSFNVTVNGDDSLNDVMDAINNAEGNEDADGNQLVRASIVDNYLVIESSNTGISNSFSFTDYNGVLKELGVIDDAGSIINELQSAQDAVFKVDSLEIKRESNQIDDVITGVTLNLEGKLNTAATLKIEPDKEAMKEKIKAFVDQYNSTQDKCGKYGGKKGKLQGDSILRSLESAFYNSTVLPNITISSEDWLSDNPLRGAGSLVINGNTVDLNGTESLSEIVDKIGSTADYTAELKNNRIVLKSTGSRPVNLSGSSSRVLNDLMLPENFQNNTISLLGVEVDKYGKLNIDDEKLDKAIEENLTDIKQMFTGINGVEDRLTRSIDLAVDSFDGYVNGRIDSLEAEVKYIDDDIESLETRLNMREEMLKAQFSQMDKLLSQMNNQSSWLNAQFGNIGLF